MATKLINWASLEVFDGEGNVQDDATARKALDEYRRTGGMLGFWIVDPLEADADGEIDGVELAACGPKVDEIDWSDFHGPDE